MEYAKDVIEFLDFCSKSVGRQAEDDFSQNTFGEWDDLKILSPIEQLFYTAFKALAQYNRYPEHDVFHLDGVPFVSGLQVTPQYAIKSYRVDFYIVWHGYVPAHEPASKRVVVECDSQEWHERTEKERRYEKRRDRELAREGLHTFRFTGKEIKENPFKPASEVLSFITDTKAEWIFEPTTEL